MQIKLLSKTFILALMQLAVRNIFKMQVQSFHPQDLYHIKCHVCLPQFMLQSWP